jgi:hypothetical protein
MNDLEFQQQVLVNGCSFSRGPNSWPYFLQKKIGFNLVNLAQAGAGNTYIHHSTVSELSLRKYDLVLIMWSGLNRIDVQVEDIELFDRTPHTSKYQSARNDWAEKIVVPVNDQDYVEKNWVFGGGFVNSDPVLKKTGLFDGFYRYCGLKQFLSSSLVHMISLQSFLKQQDIPYVFMFYNDYVDLLKTDSKYILLDQPNLFIDDNLNSLAHNNNSYDIDNMHPGSFAHQIWADKLQNFLNCRQ